MREPFPAALEQAFQDDLIEQKRRTTREGSLLAAALFGTFALLDAWAIPGAVHWVLAIRFGVVVPLLLAIAWLAGHPRFPRFYAALMILMFTVMGLAIEAMVWLAAPGELARSTYYSGLILVVVALHAWSYLDMAVNAVIGFGLVIIYVVIALVSHGGIQDANDLGVLLSNLFFFVSANLIGLYGVRTRDRTLRENYLLRHSLHHARMDAERLAQLKSRFLANMSHEIRTPLNGVLGMAQVGHRASDAGDTARAHFARILDAGALLRRIIDDILTFSKLESDRVAIETLPFAPRRLIEDALSLVAAQVGARPLSLIRRIDPGLPAACLGDPTRLTQILLNLLGNAVKFTETGTVTLEARRQGDRMVFAVTDTGPGMTPAQIERLFIPFEQADASIARQYGGTGLGLAISQRLATLMDGTLRVESTPGAGSRFELWLPCMETAVSELPIDPPCREGRDRPPRLTGMRILVAEDNPVNQQVLEELLRLEGAVPTLADDGRRAIDAVARQPDAFDAVLMDLSMPELDGAAAARRIAALAPGLPVIGQTAHALDAEYARCRDGGMVDILAKPLDHEQVVAMLLRHARPGRVEATDRFPGRAAHPRAARARPAAHARLVAAFRAHHADDPRRLRRAVETGDLAAALDIVHGLKGVAGYIGATGIQTGASALHAGLRQPDAGTPGRILALADQLEQLLDRLDRMDRTDAVPNPSGCDTIDH